MRTITEVQAFALGLLLVVVRASSTVATVDQPNTLSIRVVEKLGMRLQEEKVIQDNPLLFYVLDKDVDRTAPSVSRS